MSGMNDRRADFPKFQDDTYHYLDTTATSLTPNVVLDAVDAYYRTYRANVHRGLFPDAVRATEEFERARVTVAGFIGAPNANEIIFTSGATESSNVLLRMLEESQVLKHDAKNVVVSQMEHHAALLPLQQLAKRKNFEVRTIPLVGLELDYTAAGGLITAETALVSIILGSNVTGTINDVRCVADIAHKYGAIVVVDATAAAGHVPVDVATLGADALYFSGHKMFAPTGVGVLWVNSILLSKLSPVMFGGGMISHFESHTPVWAKIPERFEAGTKNVGGVIGLGSAIAYINTVGLDPIHKHNATLTFSAIHKLEQIPGVQVLSPCDASKNLGIVSFTCDFAHPHDVAEVLAREGVAVRAGHHCAIPLHDALGVPATTRASFHIYNTMADVDALVAGVQKARAIFTA